MTRIFSTSRSKKEKEVVLDEFGLEQEEFNLFEEPKWYRKYLFHIILGIIIVTMLIIRTFFYTFYLVSGESMMPTIENFEIAVIDKRTEPSEYNHGDIIIFSGEKYYVKRIIAKGGDKIKIEDNKVFVNGEQIKEEYLNLDYMITMNNLEERKIPKDSFFVMGDNRNSSTDSRNGLGLATVETIKGRVVTHIKIPLSFN